MNLEMPYSFQTLHLSDIFSYQVKITNNYPYSNIWVAFEKGPFKGTFDAFCPRNGKVFVQPIQAWTFTNKELAGLRKIKHKNILEYLECGAFMAYDPTSSVGYAIITEACQAFTLYKLIHERHAEFSVSTSIHICVQLVDAMLYLHSKGIDRTAITSHKIFLLPTYSIKIGGYRFGQSEQVVWTMWSAPEERVTIPENQRNNYAYQLCCVDVYSFGITLYELLFNVVPFNCVNVRLFLMSEIEAGRACVEMPNTQNGIPTSMQKAIIWNRLRACVQFNYQGRPTMVQVLAILMELHQILPRFFVPK